MPILATPEFIERIGETEADTVAGVGPRGERAIDEVKVGQALAFADSMIVGKLRARYPTLPEPAPELLKGIAQDIALYRLRYRTGDQSGITSETVQRYKAAIAELEAIARGDTALDPAAPGPGAGGDTTAAPVLSAGEPSRSGQILRGW